MLILQILMMYLNTVDFISFSYYSSKLTSADPEVNKQTAGNVFATLKNPYLKASEWGWQIDPLGLRLMGIFDKLLNKKESLQKVLDTEITSVCHGQLIPPEKN